MKNIILLLCIFLVSCSSVKKNLRDKAVQIPNQINYIEIPSDDMIETKRFFHDVFGWSFVDYGPDYIGFTDQVHGGFYKSDLKALTKNGSALVIFYSNELGVILEKIKSAGGIIIKPIFSYPGGRRFHFLDTNGNEYAVWSE